MNSSYKLLIKNSKQAEKFVSDAEKLKALLNEALVKANQSRVEVTKVWDDLLLLINLLKAYLRGQYKEVPWRTLILIISAIIYFVNPFDVIPDFVSGLGFIDDVSVFSFVVGSLKQDLERFRKYSPAYII